MNLHYFTKIYVNFCIKEKSDVRVEWSIIWHNYFTSTKGSMTKSHPSNDLLFAR